MAIEYSKDHPVAKEMRKWEYGDRDEGFRGHREHVEFPKMLYKASRDPKMPSKFVFPPENQISVANADEESRYLSRGFHVSQDSAVKALEGDELEISRLAANRAHNECKMSDKARAEADQADLDAGDAHLAEVPVKPVKKAGRKARA